MVDARMTKTKKKSRIFSLLGMASLFTLSGCELFETMSSSSDDVSLKPLDATFSIYANDPAANDSLEQHLSTGVLMRVFPNGQYTLSFDADSTHEAPKLQLYRLIPKTSTTYIIGNRTRSLEATDSAGRWVYHFDCQESDLAFWGTSLVEDGEYYSGEVQNLRFEGSGSNSLHFKVNLIVAGSYDGTQDNVSLDSLSRLMLEKFRSSFAAGGAVVDTLYLHYASERTDLSNFYPDNEPWLAGKSSDDYFVSELGGWPNSDAEPDIYNALDIVLVHRIEKTGILGYSALFSGNFGGGDGSTVVIGTHYLENNSRETSQSALQIVLTAIHESGHFFGLRHTTSTTTEVSNALDKSNVQDGLEDTPHCGALIPLLANSEVSADYLDMPSEVMPRIVLAKMGVMCPDALNPMFPISADNPEDTEAFTEDQLEFMAKMLQLYTH